MPMRIISPPGPGQLIYCPYHRAWEVNIGEDPALCDYCCQFVPCPMHDAEVGDGLDIIAREHSDWRVFDPFKTVDDRPADQYRGRGKVVGQVAKVSDRKEVRDWVDLDDL